MSVTETATTTEVHPIISERRSTRGFDPARPLDEAVLSRLLEAGRWTASSINLQPWRFIVARRGSEAHATIVSTLKDFNLAWAPDAAVFIAVLADLSESPARFWAEFDAGAAATTITLQATHEGLATHQMGGFDFDAFRTAFDVPSHLQPISVLAVGHPGSIDHLPEALIERESAPRERKPLDDLLLVNA